MLIPAGALGLRGAYTPASNWIVLLALYASSKLFDFGDAAIFRVTGGLISGHSLMHLNLALAVGRVAYCASVAAAPSRVGGPVSGTSQRKTSLNTSS